MKVICGKLYSVVSYKTTFWVVLPFWLLKVPIGSQAELQKVADLPSNLKFMLSTILIFTQYAITGKQLDGVLCTRQKYVIRDLPISFVCLSASIRALTRFQYKGGHSLKEAIH